MHLYVSAHDVLAARHVAAELTKAGYTLASDWHAQAVPGGRTSSLTDDDKVTEAAHNLTRLETADALVLVAAPDMVPGGKFVEAGAALGAGKRVYVVGRRENLLLWHPLVFAFPDVCDLIAALASALA